MVKKKKNNKSRIIPRIILITAVLLTLAVVMTRLLPIGSKAISDIDEYGSKSIAESDPDLIPDYSGEDWIELNDGLPCFNAWDLSNITGEHYSELDRLGRCGVAVAMLEDSMRPTDPRGEIGEIRPSGWHQTKYEGIIDSDPPFLYNRCHLIAYAMTGQNANPENLITGTCYMNSTLMLPWEEEVMRYLEAYNGHVLYRVTPYFKEKELLARGVEIEAYSVEDGGSGVCFHVFVYNIQPGIILDYSTGESKADTEGGNG